ncbi:hypothetical protein HDU91_006315, partial [Kappamyces sp. JEL0680]
NTELSGHLKDSLEQHTKSQKLVTLDLNKKLDEFSQSLQLQIEANARKLSQLTLNVEGQALQNQNDHLMITEDIAFTKRLLANGHGAGAAKDGSQLSTGPNEDLMAELQRSLVLIEEARKDAADFAMKAQAYERFTNSRFLEVNEHAEKSSLELQSRVGHLSDLVNKTQAQIDENHEEVLAQMEQASKDMRVLKGEIGKLELENVRIQGEIGRLARDVTAVPNEGLTTLVKPMSSKLDTLADRISSLEDTVQTGIETAKRTGSPSRHSGQETDLEGAESILSARHTPKTPNSRAMASTDNGSGSIFKPNLKSGKTTPRSEHRNEASDESSEKVPLRHTPSKVEF